ncbi:bifunctional non-homologous end joining protein LigD [Paraburkholderia sp. BL8N3]|nr:DNA ligase [Paraburkholderia sp. BL8N3]TCK36698.1 bifunctional non-homologous end joining protein LigD [Paraburkholderia sp. BL8N3]
MMAEQPGVPLLHPIEAKDLMLATLRRTPFSQEGWLYELKYDGFRCLVRKHGASVDLISRPGKSLNRSFPDIVAAVSAVSGDFVWDAELTVDNPGGHSSFERLQKRAKTSIPMRVRAAVKEHPARLYAFDMLAIGGRDLRGLPLIERKAFLQDSFETSDRLIFVNGIVGAGQWVFEQVQMLGFEGMMAKRLDSLYRRGRTTDWQKIKFAGNGRAAAFGFGKPT